MELVWREVMLITESAHIAVPKGRRMDYQNSTISYSSLWDHVNFFYGPTLIHCVEYRPVLSKHTTHAVRRKFYEAQYYLNKPQDLTS